MELYNKIYLASVRSVLLKNYFHYRYLQKLILFYFYFLVFFFVFSRAVPAAYGGSQARGLIRAVAAGLHHSHGNARSELYLGPTPQLMAMLDP